LAFFDPEMPSERSDPQSGTVWWSGQLTSVSLPSATGTIRARGYVTGGEYNGSSWFVESDVQLTGVASPPPVILVNDPSFGFSSNRFGFKLSGAAGQVVVVETSTNLTSWTPVATLKR
jgi:hypothetical protein